MKLERGALVGSKEPTLFSGLFFEGTLTHD